MALVVPTRPRTVDRRICVAPMMDYTDRHCRYLLRLCARRAVLYTEMVTSAALIHGDAERHLRFHSAEHPLAVQLGGSEPAELARCAKLAETYGYDEINLNVGCPSDRVRSGRFGACLMLEPERVADCVAAMTEAVAVPVTVKTRLGVDHNDSYGELTVFTAAVASAGCATLIVHARKAWLQGLSPKENREIPPLDYSRVYRLKRDFPALEIILNGGVTTAAAVGGHLRHVDGVMIGREAYRNPLSLAQMAAAAYGDGGESADPWRVVDGMLPYVEEQLRHGIPLQAITRHMLGLFQGIPGAKAWRRYLTERARLPGAGIEVIGTAAAMLGPVEPATA